MSSDDEIEDISSWKGIPATIIYINIYDPGNLNTAEVAYTATCQLMRQYLRTSSSQYIAVCLYGVEGSSSSVFGIKTIEEVFPLALPSLESFKKLQKLKISSLKQTKELILSDVLWHSRKMFASCKKQLLSRSVLLLSRFDTPPILSDQTKSFNEAVDSSISNIELKLVNISQTEYAVHQFYTDLLINATKGQHEEFPKALWEQGEIVKLMHQQCNRHLAVSQLSFEIGEGISIGVGVYSLLVKSQAKKISLDRETNAILTSVNKTTKVTLDDDENMEVDGEDNTEKKGVPLLKSEILHYQTIGGQRIEFSDDEMKTLRNPFGQPKLILLGFKPAQILCKEKWIFKPCYFLYPSENIIEGSTVAFKALHKACIETGTVAICILCTRVNAKPNIVALSPCRKPLCLNIEIGFDVIRIPFVENVRNIPPMDDEDLKVPDAGKRVMKDILSELKFNYTPETFENPKLQSQYRAIEAIALEDEEVEPMVDTTMPDPKIFNNINDELFQDVFGPFESLSGKKRVAKEVVRPKKAKVSEEELKERFENDSINSLTVSELKDILRSKEIPDLPALTGLVKKQLVDLVYKNFE